MNHSRQHSGMNNSHQGAAKARSGALSFALLFIAVLVLDQVSKRYFEVMLSALPGNSLLIMPGIFRLNLVHNTGAAWGLFSNSTIILGIISIVISVLLFLYAFVFRKDTPKLQVLAIALVCAGGIGNAIDRFTNAYVIDFLEVLFIDFPVFNIADIGVTCGIVILILAMVLELRHDKEAKCLE